MRCGAAVVVRWTLWRTKEKLSNRQAAEWAGRGGWRELGEGTRCAMQFRSFEQMRRDIVEAKRDEKTKDT